MAKVFVSFLGTTNYSEVKYAGSKRETKFVQAAIVEKHGAGFFDRVRILVTRSSKEKHWGQLEQQLREYAGDGDISFEEISEDLQKDQWKWFSTILDLINEGDEIWFDMTNGFRAFSIILSVALGFIQKTKNISLKAVYYGAKEAVGQPIVDMKDFYIINEWADSVGRLTSDADARKLGELAENSNVEILNSLNDEKLIDAFNEMTECIRNVDVNNISSRVSEALNLIEKKRADANGPTRLLLDLVWRKFSSFAIFYPPTGYYDAPYFKTQLQIISVLLEHKLYMQAFTAMRELIGSIGMAGLEGKYSKAMTTNDGRGYRGRFAETFINMLQFKEDEWKFTSENHEKLMPWYEKLKQNDVIKSLKDIVEKRKGDMTLLDYRNGFDHGWTSKAGVAADIQEKGEKYLKMLESIIGEIEQIQKRENKNEFVEK